MGPWLSITYEAALSLLVFLVSLSILSCAPPVQPLPTPPESYHGPVAEQPILQKGDYWVYQRASLTKTKIAALFPNIGFPLWIGKTWSYDGEALLRGQPQTSKASRTPTHVNCRVLAFNQVTVTAGTFGAFECECQCTVISVGYDTLCGTWTIWYAPDVKNVIRQKTESTETSLELVEYKVSRPSPGAKVVQEKLPGAPEPKFEAK
jgi:hypothetical protein